MRSSPLQYESFAEDSSRDAADMITLGGLHENALDDWRLPSPFSVSFPKMNDLPFVPRCPTPHQDSRALSSSRAERQAVACQSPSKEVQNRPSTATDDTESSNPGMMEDPFGWSDSDMSLEDDHNYHASTAELWDSFWSTRKEFPDRSSSKSDARKGSPPHKQDSKLRPSTRNYARLNHSDIAISERENNLHRSGYQIPICSASASAVQVLPQPTYSAFPPVIHSNTSPHEPGHVTHKSWPLPNDPLPSSRCAPQRSRAATNPGQATRPSNLSYCTTVSNQSQSSPGGSRPFYMRSAPSSSEVVIPLMELMEKSVFEEDDEEKTGLMALTNLLHKRSHSGDASNRQGPKRKSLRRSASEVLKGVFGMKK